MANSFTDTALFVETVLNSYVLGSSQSLSRRELPGYRHNIRVFEMLGESLVVNLMTHVWGEPDQEVVVEEVPLTWWDHLKQRWFPAWALNRWPVQHRQVTTTVRVLYPNLKIQVPDQRPVLHIVKELPSRGFAESTFG